MSMLVSSTKVYTSNKHVTKLKPAGSLEKMTRSQPGLRTAAFTPVSVHSLLQKYAGVRYANRAFGIASGIPTTASDFNSSGTRE